MPVGSAFAGLDLLVNLLSKCKAPLPNTALDHQTSRLLDV